MICNPMSDYHRFMLSGILLLSLVDQADNCRFDFRLLTFLQCQTANGLPPTACHLLFVICYLPFGICHLLFVN